MPPSIPGAEHLPGHPATVFESTSQKWAGLSPWAQRPYWTAPRTSWSHREYSWHDRCQLYIRRPWSDDAWADDTTTDHHHTASASTWSDNRAMPTARPRHVHRPGEEGWSGIQERRVPVTSCDEQPHARRIFSRGLVAADMQELPAARAGSSSIARPPPRTA